MKSKSRVDVVTDANSFLLKVCKKVTNSSKHVSNSNDDDSSSEFTGGNLGKTSQNGARPNFHWWHAKKKSSSTMKLGALKMK